MTHRRGAAQTASAPQTALSAIARFCPKPPDTLSGTSGFEVFCAELFWYADGVPTSVGDTITMALFHSLIRKPIDWLRSHPVAARLALKCTPDVHLHLHIPEIGRLRIRGLLEIEWVILGVKVVKGPVDIGFWRLGPTRRSGIMRDGEIGQGTASAVGWIFVRGLSGARDRSWGIW